MNLPTQKAIDQIKNQFLQHVVTVLVSQPNLLVIYWAKPNTRVNSCTLTLIHGVLTITGDIGDVIYDTRQEFFSHLKDLSLERFTTSTIASPTGTGTEFNLELFRRGVIENSASDEPFSDNSNPPPLTIADFEYIDQDSYTQFKVEEILHDAGLDSETIQEWVNWGLTPSYRTLEHWILLPLISAQIPSL